MYACMCHPEGWCLWLSGSHQEEGQANPQGARYREPHSTMTASQNELKQSHNCHKGSIIIALLLFIHAALLNQIHCGYFPTKSDFLFSIVSSACLSTGHISRQLLTFLQATRLAVCVCVHARAHVCTCLWIGVYCSSRCLFALRGIAEGVVWSAAVFSSREAEELRVTTVLPLMCVNVTGAAATQSFLYMYSLRLWKIH